MPKPRKICTNCRGDWDKCLGYRCVCMEGVCCDGDQEAKISDSQYNYFGYILEDES